MQKYSFHRFCRRCGLEIDIKSDRLGQARRVEYILKSDFCRWDRINKKPIEHDW
jgi:hypothetical protein